MKKEQKRLARENERLHKKMSKVEQENANEFDGGISAQLLTSATSNTRGQGVSAHSNAQYIAVHDVRLQRLEISTAILTED